MDVRIPEREDTARLRRRNLWYLFAINDIRHAICTKCCNHAQGGKSSAKSVPRAAGCGSTRGAEG